MDTEATAEYDVLTPIVNDICETLCALSDLVDYNPNLVDVNKSWLLKEFNKYFNKECSYQLLRIMLNIQEFTR